MTPEQVREGGSGNGALTKNGTGTLTLSGNNTYNGTTTISAGTLQLGNGVAPGKLSTSSSITVNAGATLAFNNNNISEGTFAQGVDFASGISGNGSVAMLGGNLLMNIGANTYSGGFNLISGTVQLGSNAAAIGTGTLTISGGVLSTGAPGQAGQVLTTTNPNIWSGNFTLAGRVTNGSGAWNNNGTVLLSGGSRTVTGANRPNLNFGGVISDGGNNYGLSFTDFTRVTMSAVNTYTGTTTISGGHD